MEFTDLVKSMSDQDLADYVLEGAALYLETQTILEAMNKRLAECQAEIQRRIALWN